MRRIDKKYNKQAASELLKVKKREDSKRIGKQLTYGELRLCVRLIRAFNIGRQEIMNPSRECEYVYDLRDKLVALYDDEFIYYFSRVLLDLILNNDKENLDEVFDWLHVRCGEYYEEYKADYRQRSVDESISYRYSQQRLRENLYKDLSNEQCAVIRDWIEVVSGYHDVLLDFMEDEVMDAYVYWDERSRQ